MDDEVHPRRRGCRRGRGASPTQLRPDHRAPQALTDWSRGTCAEGVGFEPTEACASMVFKTIPFGRSGIPPGARLGPARLDTVEPEQRIQNLRNGERAVGMLVVLEQEHQCAPDGAGGAVERVYRARAPVGAKARA